MSSPDIILEPKGPSKRRSQLLRQISALGQDTAGLSLQVGEEKEKAQYSPYWMRPASLMYIANRAAKNVRRGHGSSLMRNDDCEDMASATLEAFYSLNVFDRPQSEREFELFAYRTLGSIARRIRRDRVSSVELESVRGDHGRESNHPADVLIGIYDPGVSRSSARQESYMQVMDVLRALAALGSDDRTLIWKIVDCGTIVEFADEYGVSLFEAMAEQRRIRAVARRLLDDNTDDRKDSAIGCDA